MNMKFVRTWAMLALVMVIGLSVTGGTIAWFTDSVSSTQNVIKSGTLDIKLYAGDTEITDGSTTPIFNYSFWEPGYTTTAKLKIENAGDLALKYTFGINPESVTTDEAYNLADVIDVYVFDAGTEVTRAAVNAATPVGTLTSLSTTGFYSGVLLPAEGKGATDVNPDSAPKGSVEKILVLKMKESADNNYQNLSLNNLTIKLDATQYTYEEDAFDNQYDANATYDGTVNNPDDPDDPSDPETELPDAAVTEMEPEERSGLTLSSYLGFGPEDVPDGLKNDDGTMTLDYGMTFEATETTEDIAGKPYENWHADFVVSINKEITAADCVNGAPLVLVGNYGTYGWVPIAVNPTDLGLNKINANEEYRLLASVTGIDDALTYSGVVNFVQKFQCGVKADPTWATEGTTITVQLIVWELDADGNEIEKHVIETASHTY